MIDKNDIQKLIDLPIEGVAERLGLRVERHKSLCPFHEDSHPSLSYNRSRNRYRCFVCGAHGRTIDLVANHLNLKFPDACQWLAGEHNVILTQWQPAEKPIVHQPFDAARYVRFFDRPFLNDSARRFLFDERKLDPRVVRWCRLTSYTDRNGTPWLQIPYYDIDGHLMGVQSRNLAFGKSSSINHQSSVISNQSSSINHQSSVISNQSSPRFRFPKGSKCLIYNLPVLKLLRQGEPLFITEGASDCWAMLSSGHKAIAIPSATLLNRKDLQILSTLNSQLSTVFHMYPDQDEPGERLFLDLRRLLEPHAPLVRHQLPADCKDYSDYYLRKH